MENLIDERLPQKTYYPGEIKDAFDFENILMSQEAYFGDTNTFKIEMVNLTETLQKTVKDLVDTKAAKRKESYVTVTGESLRSILNKMNECVQRNLNVEKMEFSIFIGDHGAMNAFAIPLCYDRNLIVEDRKGKKKIDKDYMKSLEDILETKKGYKFKTPNGKILACSLSETMLLNDEMTPEMVCGTIFHELGHALEHMLGGINAQICDRVVMHDLQMAHMLLNPLLLLITKFGSGFATLISTIRAYTRVEGDKLTVETVDVMMQDLNKETDRDEMIGELSNRKKLREILGKLDKMKQRKFMGLLIKTLLGIFNILDMIVGYVIGGFSTFGGVALMKVPQLLFSAANYGELRKLRKYEQFADTFATAYGLGPDLTAGLKLIGNSHEKCDLGLINFINYVPLLNIVLATNEALNTTQALLFAGYPSSKKRIVGQYQILEYELKNNPSLSDKDKKDIMRNMEEIKVIYDEYLNGKGGKNLVYKMYHKALNAKIENEKTDIIENVASVINDYEKDQKLSSNKKEEISTGKLMKAMKGMEANIKTLL